MNLLGFLHRTDQRLATPPSRQAYCTACGSPMAERVIRLIRPQYSATTGLALDRRQTWWACTVPTGTRDTFVSGRWHSGFEDFGQWTVE